MVSLWPFGKKEEELPPLEVPKEAPEGTGIENIREKVELLTTKVDNMRTQFDSLKTQQDTLNERLKNIERMVSEMYEMAKREG
jgi:uncharacterized coiled-coil DUF342 family protein